MTQARVKIARTAAPPTPTPTPMPALAPVESPEDGADFADDEDVDVVIGMLPMEEAVELDDVVVVAELEDGVEDVLELVGVAASGP